MVRGPLEAIPSTGLRLDLSMEASTAEARASLGRADSGAERRPTVIQPRKKRPEDFKFGKILGEGSFSTVSGKEGCSQTEL